MAAILQDEGLYCARSTKRLQSRENIAEIKADVQQHISNFFRLVDLPAAATSKPLSTVILQLALLWKGKNRRWTLQQRIRKVAKLLSIEDVHSEVAVSCFATAAAVKGNTPTELAILAGG